MKRKTFTRSIMAISIMGIGLSLASCSASSTGVCYFLDSDYTYDTAAILPNTGMHQGDFIGKASVTVNKGTIVSTKIEETYSPSVWARVDAAKAAEEGLQTITIDNCYDFEGNQKSLTFAKHIEIGEYTFTGSPRDMDNEAALCKRGEYVVYKYDHVIGTSDPLTDLYTYLSVPDSDLYKLGSRFKWYWEQVMNNNIHFLINNGDEESSSSSESSSSISYKTSTISPYFPNDSKLRNENPVYSNWEKSISKLDDFFKEKKMNFQYSFVDPEDPTVTHRSLKANTTTNTWMYNPNFMNGDYDESDDKWINVDGVDYIQLDDAGNKINITYVDSEGDDRTVPLYSVFTNSIQAYFTSVDKAFASVEYETMK